MSESSPSAVNEFQFIKQEESSPSLDSDTTDEKHRQSIRLAKGLAAHNMKPLPDGYELGESDVICGRGRKCFNHVGNQRFRKMVEDCLPKYAEATAKLEKTYIICEVVNRVRKHSPNGGFVKKDPVTGRYFEVGDFLAREKTSQAFRDALHDQYKSSNAAKKKRRIQEQAQKLHKQHSAPMLSRTAILQSTNDLAAERNGMMFQQNNGYAHDDYAVNNSKWMRVETQHDSMSNGFMGANTNNENGDARMDLLLGELNLDGGVDKRRLFASQKSATSVVQDINNTPAWFNRSCPNLQKPVETMRASPLLHEPIQEAADEDAHMVEDFSAHSSHRSTGGWHHSTPNLFERLPQPETSLVNVVSSTSDQFYSGSLKKARSDRHLGQSTGFCFDLYGDQPDHASSSSQVIHQQQQQQQRPLYQEDIVLSPIGDGSTRGLFEKLQGIEETVDEFLDPLPF